MVWLFGSCYIFILNYSKPFFAYIMRARNCRWIMRVALVNQY
jgi:hypothetical protein